MYRQLFLILSFYLPVVPITVLIAMDKCSQIELFKTILSESAGNLYLIRKPSPFKFSKLVDEECADKGDPNEIHGRPTNISVKIFVDFPNNSRKSICRRIFRINCYSSRKI